MIQCAVRLVCAHLGTSGKPTYRAGSWDGPSAMGREEEGGQLDLPMQLVPHRGLRLETILTMDRGQHIHECKYSLSCAAKESEG